MGAARGAFAGDAEAVAPIEAQRPLVLREDLLADLPAAGKARLFARKVEQAGADALAPQPLPHGESVDVEGARRLLFQGDQRAQQVGPP